MDRWQIGMCALALIFLSLVTSSDAHAERDWALTLYSGRMTGANLTKTATFNFEFEDAYLIDLGLSRRLYTFQNYFDIEIEGQLANTLEIKTIGNSIWWPIFVGCSFPGTSI